MLILDVVVTICAGMFFPLTGVAANGGRVEGASWSVSSLSGHSLEALSGQSGVMTALATAEKARTHPLFLPTIAFKRRRNMSSVGKVSGRCVLGTWGKEGWVHKCVSQKWCSRKGCRCQVGSPIACVLSLSR